MLGSTLVSDPTCVQNVARALHISIALVHICSFIVVNAHINVLSVRSHSLWNITLLPTLEFIVGIDPLFVESVGEHFPRNVIWLPMQSFILVSVHTYVRSVGNHSHVRITWWSIHAFMVASSLMHVQIVEALLLENLNWWTTDACMVAYHIPAMCVARSSCRSEHSLLMLVSMWKENGHLSARRVVRLFRSNLNLLSTPTCMQMRSPSYAGTWISWHHSYSL